MKAGTNSLFKALGFSLLVSSSASAMAITLSTGDEVTQNHDATSIIVKPDHRSVRYCDSDSSIDDFMPEGRYDDDSTDTPQSDGEVVFEEVSIFNMSKYFTKSFQIESEGTYQAVLTDFRFPRPMEISGINITSATESLGMLTGPGYFTFDAEPGNYYLSFFGEAGRLGQYGIEISMASSAVPVPAAVWLFSSGLLGLVGVVRRKAA